MRKSRFPINLTHGQIDISNYRVASLLKMHPSSTQYLLKTSTKKERNLISAEK